VDQNELLHLFDHPIANSAWPHVFPYPFYHKPDNLALKAAEQVKKLIANKTKHDFDEQGKMFGVLVVEYDPGELGFLMGYSGKLKYDERPKGFVPPVVDVHQKDSFFKVGEKVLDALTLEIESLISNPDFIRAKTDYKNAQKELGAFLESYRKEIKANKARRKLARKEIINRESKEQLAKLSELSLESKLEQLAYKKEKKNRSAALVSLEERFVCFEKDIKTLKERRAEKSKKIQEDVFKTSSFLNFKGETENLLSLFKDTYEGVPPAGAGECSAPRMLQSCYKLGFKPITFTEFWWGAPPKKQLRLHNTHYAACRGKCEPILNHMLEGVNVEESPLDATQKDKLIEKLYEDKDLLVVNKPHGLLSVPGKNIKQSVISVLKKEHSTTFELYPVHRLDRQTSGVLLLAKNKTALAALQMQFEKRSTKKEYVALLDGTLTQKEGTIVLPLATDYNDRPRQLVCFERGKYAETTFTLLGVEKNTSRVRFYPKTGRSHQLRVHSAFHDGLNMAIVGDDLYGKHQDRMYLHAEKLVFMHPETNKEVTVFSKTPF
jgi:tRNA pseudouridine32 synthase/23S rRNA pseudouridine746 synthase